MEHWVLYCVNMILLHFVLLLILGKSYTITGVPAEPGLLPRALDAIFNSINLQQQLSGVKVRPERFSEVRYIGGRDLEREQQWKENILNMVSKCNVSVASDTLPGQGDRVTPCT